MPEGCWLGRGKDTSGSSKEHASGNALDIMIVPVEGARANGFQRQQAFKIINWLIANQAKIGLRWVIFDKGNNGYAQSFNPERGHWKVVRKGANVSDAHADHIHVYLKPGGKFSDLNMEHLTGSKVTPRKEDKEMDRNDLNSTLNDNAMISLIASRIGAMDTRIQNEVVPLLKELVTEIRGLRTDVH